MPREVKLTAKGRSLEEDSPPGAGDKGSLTSLLPQNVATGSVTCTDGEVQGSLCVQKCVGKEPQYVNDFSNTGPCNPSESCSYNIRYPSMDPAVGENGAAAADQDCSWVIDRRAIIQNFADQRNIPIEDIILKGAISSRTPNGGEPSDNACVSMEWDNRMIDTWCGAKATLGFNAYVGDYIPVEQIRVTFRSGAGALSGGGLTFSVYPVEVQRYGYWSTGLIFFAVLLGVLILSGIGLWAYSSWQQKRKRITLVNTPNLVTEAAESPYEGPDMPCALCLTNLDQGQMVKTINCPAQHVYHSACIDAMVRNGTTSCPQCRAAAQSQPIPYRKPVTTTAIGAPVDQPTLAAYEGVSNTSMSVAAVPMIVMGSSQAVIGTPVVDTQQKRSATDV